MNRKKCAYLTGLKMDWMNKEQAVRSANIRYKTEKARKRFLKGWKESKE